MAISATEVSSSASPPRRINKDITTIVQHHSPAANTAAVITLTAPGTGKAWVLRGICHSYSIPPAIGSGKITVAAGGTTIFEATVQQQGLMSVPGLSPDSEWVVDANTAVVITLAAGGSGVTGDVNCNAYVVKVEPQGT